MKKINSILFVGHSLHSPFAPAIIANLQKLGYEVTFFDQFRPTFVSKMLGVINNRINKEEVQSVLNFHINDSLKKVVTRHNPDLIFVFKGKNISSETVACLRSKGYLIVNWYPDYYDDWQWIKDTASFYDYFFTPCEYVQKELKKLHITSYYLPFAADADKYFITSKKRYNATFVGRFTPRRDTLFRKVFEEGLLDIWGYSHWQNSRYASRYHGQVPPTECINIIRKSRITINTLTATDEVPLISVNYRVFEATGVGGFVLSSYHYPFEKFFKLGKEIEIFDSSAEAAEKTRFYLNNESAREKIEKAGWERTKKDHSYKRRLKQLLRYIS